MTTTRRVGPDEAVAQCLAAYEAAARQQYEREGSKDFGACGGSMVGYRGNTRFAIALEAANRGLRMDGKVYLSSFLPDGVQTQSANVFQAAARAFRLKADELGYPCSKSWDYVD